MARKSSALAETVKTTIITHLAMFETPSKVRDLVQQEHGLTLKLNTITYYDPTTSEKRLAKKYKELFERTREKYLESTARVPVMNQVYRARMLQKILEQELEARNTVAAKATLEQAAKEVGGAFTNKREHTGAGGAPIAHALTVHFVTPTPPPEKTNAGS